MKTATNPEQALRQIPDARAAVIARGKALIADPNYPSVKEIKAVARHLAACWTEGTPGGELLDAASPSAEVAPEISRERLARAGAPAPDIAGAQQDN